MTPPIAQQTPPHPSEMEHEHRLIGVEHGALSALAGHLPEVNALLESSFNEISTDFMKLNSLLSQQHQALDPLMALLPEQMEDYQETRERMQTIITKLVSALQFQDRVSQLRLRRRG